MKNEKHEYAFFSTPKGLNLLIPPENLHEICVEHNLEIAGRYTDSWVIKQWNYEYFRKKMKTELSLEQCKALLKELKIFKNSCLDALKPIDLGVEIDGQQNITIQEDYQRLKDFTKEIIPAIESDIETIKEEIELLKKNDGSRIKKDGITAVTIAHFCVVVNDSKLKPKNYTERNEDYCKRICLEYRLNYTDRVRQNFSNKITEKSRKIIRDVLLPRFDNETQQHISAYLSTKYKETSKLFA